MYQEAGAGACRARRFSDAIAPTRSRFDRLLDLQNPPRHASVARSSGTPRQEAGAPSAARGAGRAPRRTLAVLLLPAILLLPARASAQRIPWIWDLGNLPSPVPAEIAPVVRQVWLHDDAIEVRAGAHAGAPPAGVLVTPVVHVELSWAHPPVDPSRHAAEIREIVLRAAALGTSGWVQLDLEARPSQRAFQRDLVRDIHAALHGRVRLSVTALAWWCRAPGWLDGLDADEIVPMFFRMGRDGPEVKRLLEPRPSGCTRVAVPELPGSRRSSRWHRPSSRAMRAATGSTGIPGDNPG